jgi:hypothetical protein
MKSQSPRHGPAQRLSQDKAETGKVAAKIENAGAFPKLALHRSLERAAMRLWEMVCRLCATHPFLSIYFSFCAGLSKVTFARRPGLSTGGISLLFIALLD